MSTGGQMILSTFSAEIDDAYVQDHPEASAGHFVCLGVSDTGTGMDEATLARIFEPFFTTKGVGKGIGLGLATVYGILKLHNGWTEVESQVGLGTTFTIFLPASQGASAATTNVEQDMSPPSGSETLLVVEDETALRGLMRGVLGHCGYHVLEAATGSEALQVWEKNAAKVDLVLIDLVLTDGSGDELARKMQALQPGLKVVFTSRYTLEPGAQESAIQEGLNFVQKPFQPLTLGRTVRRCLDQAPSSPPAGTVPGASCHHHRNAAFRLLRGEHRPILQRKRCVPFRRAASVGGGIEMRPTVPGA
jgi:two-component system, cell cycle sensor histidine kinase and response regulator CckA